MWKLSLILAVTTLLLGCEKLDQNIDRSSSSPMESAEVDRLNRDIAAEKEHSRSQEQTIVQDVRALQLWQNRVKDSASKDIAFQTAVERQFGPLNRCLNDRTDKSCSVIEDIKTCLSSNAPKQGGNLCMVIDTLFDQQESQQQRLQEVKRCLETRDAYTITAGGLGERSINWKPEMNDCAVLIRMMESALQISNAIDKRLTDVQADLLAKIEGLESRLADEKTRFDLIESRLVNLEQEDQARNRAVRKIADEAKLLFRDLYARDATFFSVKIETFEKCFFNGFISNGNSTECN